MVAAVDVGCAAGLLCEEGPEPGQRFCYLVVKKLMPTFEFSAGWSDDEHGAPGIAVKMSGPACELNVWLSLTDVDRLRTVALSQWHDGSIKAGRSARASAFWSCDDGEVFVGIGHDDETWDFGVTMPLDEFRQMLDEIDRELREHVGGG